MLTGSWLPPFAWCSEIRPLIVARGVRRAPEVFPICVHLGSSAVRVRPGPSRSNRFEAPGGGETEKVEGRLKNGELGKRTGTSASSESVAPDQTSLGRGDFPQKGTKVTKEVHSILCFLRLLGVRKSGPWSWRGAFGGLPRFSPSGFIWVHLRLESGRVRASRTWSNQFGLSGLG